MTIDTLQYVKKLEAAGIDRKQAEAHAAALRGVVFPELATKQDLSDMGRDLPAEIAQVRNDLGAEIAQVRNELRAEIAQVRSELRVEVGQVRADMWIALAIVLATASLTTFLQRMFS
jgi:hypothetical protein